MDVVLIPDTHMKVGRYNEAVHKVQNEFIWRKQREKLNEISSSVLRQAGYFVIPRQDMVCAVFLYPLAPIISRLPG
jgi:hypothetical protein